MIEKKFFCDICREESDIEKYTKYTSQLHGIKNKAILGGDVISYDVCVMNVTEKFVKPYLSYQGMVGISLNECI
jgi:hypothetical protein